MSEYYGFVHQPKNTLPRIERVWMIVSVDQSDGNEGVCAAEVNGMMLPLIATDEKRLPFIVDRAKDIKLATNIKLKLVKFSSREEVCEI
jgi:hypothetical protein